MNYRNRALLDLAYELECTFRIPGVCEGGRGEPCHANEAAWGKGMGMKAHDFAFASGCRACHREIDQGKKVGFERAWRWHQAHVETMRQLWERGLLMVMNSKELRREGLPEKEGAPANTSHSLPPSRRKGSKRGTHCTRPSKLLPRNWNRETAEGSN